MAFIRRRVGGREKLRFSRAICRVRRNEFFSGGAARFLPSFLAAPVVKLKYLSWALSSFYGRATFGLSALWPMINAILAGAFIIHRWYVFAGVQFQTARWRIFAGMCGRTGFIRLFSVLEKVVECWGSGFGGSVWKVLTGLKRGGIRSIWIYFSIYKFFLCILHLYFLISHESTEIFLYLNINFII